MLTDDAVIVTEGRRVSRMAHRRWHRRVGARTPTQPSQSRIASFGPPAYSERRTALPGPDLARSPALACSGVAVRQPGPGCDVEPTDSGRWLILVDAPTGQIGHIVPAGDSLHLLVDENGSFYSTRGEYLSRNSPSGVTEWSVRPMHAPRAVFAGRLWASVECGIKSSDEAGIDAASGAFLFELAGSSLA